ncbi:hypothetical protein CMV_014854 [Castanea mollissima]|uniref:Uncharacterized protein n=1 Tax=Castanea mollissima TaxID=60419 RepID=A0A8J4RBT1_9ROSI|nr:hypothetical protein CMV_014854 [Castanea mollissima]
MTVSPPLSPSVLLSHNPVGSSPSRNRFFAGSISQFALLIESTNLAADLFCFPRYGFWDDFATSTPRNPTNTESSRPCGILVYQTTKKRASGPKCPVTGKRIQGDNPSLLG